MFEINVIISIIIIYVLLFIVSSIFNYLIISLLIIRDKKLKETKIKKTIDIEGEFEQKDFINWIKRFLQGIVFGWIRYSTILTGRIPSHRIRNIIYKKVFRMNIKKNVVIYGGSEIRDSHKIFIGEGTIIGDDSKLDGRNGIIIGSNVNFSTGVWIWTDQHDPQCKYFSCKNQGAPVKIGDRAWISCRTIILPGVEIGEGAVVAAGSVVTNDIEPYSIYGGVPAKKIGNRNRDLRYEFNGDFLSFY